ncbi:glycosyltransferase [Microbacterium sp. CCNWLW134]|uniref:glycosyltransferase n=1 Tax=Microbacterium sp. CCNWLW134 TaxID=3122064 RepID=UPI00300F8C6B
MRSVIRAMHSVAAPEPHKTRFIDHIVEGAAPDVRIETFTWKRAVQGDFDVFHIHWPERLLRKGWLKTFVLLASLRARKIPIVRTLHNLDPHEAGGAWEARLLRLIDRRTEMFIRLNNHTPLPADAQSVTIPHPHYLPRVSRRNASDAVAGRILYFGIVRPYKGVQALIDAFRDAAPPQTELRIVGSATGDRGAGVRQAMVDDQRITARLEYVTDTDLDNEIAAAELVVLPYRHMHNSGALFLALSHARPVLVPRNPVNEDISQEVGPGWVYLFDGDLDGKQLLDALRGARRGLPVLPPNLSNRDWVVLGNQLRDAYQRVLRSR